MSENATQQINAIKSSELDRFHEIEIEKVFEAMVNIQSLRLQSGIFFATANLGGLSFAFSTAKAGIIFFASLLIVAFVLIDSRARISFAAMRYRGLQLQERFAPGDPETFLNLFAGGFSDEQLRKIRALNSGAARNEALKSLPFRSRGVTSFWFPLLAFLAEVAVGITTLLVLNWSLF
jgi:hypothetical protein